MSCRHVLAMAGSLVLMSTSAHAQTNDHLYRSWRSSTLLGAPRAASLAGAFVAVADDVSTTFLNPAGLVTLRTSEVGGAFQMEGTRRIELDQGQSWMGLGCLAGAGRLSPRLAIGAYLTQLRGGRINLSSTAVLPDGSRESGFLDAAIIEGGAAVGYRFAEGLSVGIRVAASHLALEGEYRRANSRGVLVEAGTSAGQTRVTGTIGALWRMSTTLHAALAIIPGTSYIASRTANGPVGPLDIGSTYELSNPGKLSGAIAWRPGPRWLVATQGDYLSRSKAKVFVRPGTLESDQSDSHDVLEPRIGIEYSLPLHRLAVQVRSGVFWQAASGLRFVGGDPVERAVFDGGSRGVVASVGATMATASGLRFDVAAVAATEERQFLAGVRWTF